MEWGRRLREQRERAGLSLGQAAEYEQVGRQYLSKLEVGTNEPPTWDLLARLARRYRTSVDYILGLTNDPSSSADSTLTAEQQQLMQEAIDALSTLPLREQRIALDILRVMRKSEEDADGPLVPHIIE